MGRSENPTETMEWSPASIKGLDALLVALDAGETITGGSPHHGAMHAASQAAQRLTAEINGRYHAPDEIVELPGRS